MGQVPTPNRYYKTTLIPIEETISWKIHNVSQLQETNTWTALSIPVEIGFGATDLTRWKISLVRDENSTICARCTLVSPTESHKSVTHHLKAAVVTEEASDESSALRRNHRYYFANTRNRPTNNSNRNHRDCSFFLALRNYFNMRSLSRSEIDEEGDDSKAQETKYDGAPTLWRIVPLSLLRPDDDDCLEVVITMTVFGCDVSEERRR